MENVILGFKKFRPGWTPIIFKRDPDSGHGVCFSCNCPMHKSHLVNPYRNYGVWYGDCEACIAIRLTYVQNRGN